MHKSTHHRHFLTYTFEHLFGAAFIIVLSTAVGYVAQAQSIGATATTTLNIILDTTAPSAPVLHLGNVSSNSITFVWDGAADNVGVAGYQLYKNGVAIASQTSNSYTDSSNLTSGSIIAYAVKAFDAAGNSSLLSEVTTVLVPAKVSDTPISTTTATTVNTPTPVPTPTPTPAQAASTLPSVSYGATVAPITDCANGKPLTEVFLVISDAVGGKFQLSSDNGISGALFEWGRYQLANGRYTWKAVPASGYSIIGDASGSFTISGECLTKVTPPAVTATSGASATPEVTTSNSLPIKYVENTSFVPTISIDNVRIKESDSVSGNVNFTVVAQGMTRSIFVIEGAKIGKQFIDKKLGVVHKDGTNEWTVAWNTRSLPNGDYVLAALLDNSSGTTVISKRVAFTIKNDTAAAATLPTGVISTSAIVLPTIKVFVDNGAISPDALVFNNETIELRVAAANAKKVTFYALVSGKSGPLELGRGVIDDLLSGRSLDVWTFSWNAKKADQNAYKLFARVLNLDGTVTESSPMLLRIDHAPLAPLSGDNAADASTTIGGESVMTPAQKEDILARVTSPALCTTALECKVFCKSIVGSDSTCKAFAQNAIHEDIPVTSIADDISKERLENMLTDPKKRFKYLPESITHASELIDYCADPSHADICIKTLQQNDLATTESLDKKKEDLIRSRDEEKKLLSERTGARAFIDTDKDGVADYDEVNIYHTNPEDPDTDHDGFPDGEEILAHTNPNGRKAIRVGEAEVTGSTSIASLPASEGVTLEDPLIAGVTQKELLSVNNVVVGEVGFDSNGTSTAKKLKFTGSALPNSYVTLYIFSDPIVVTVKADASGEWTYTLDKELPNGSHQVVSAITNDGGHILAKSVALPFVKEAAAVSVGANALLPTQRTPGFFSGASLYAFIAILLGLLGVAFSIIGFVVHQRSPQGSDVLFPNAKDE